MRVLLSAMILPMFLAVPRPVRADFFPVAQGAVWEFDYHLRVGHSGGGTDDYGIVRWEIAALIPGGYDRIVIAQTRRLMRRTFAGYWGPSYDSAYNPPRIRVDTVRFTGYGNAFFSATGQVLIHTRNGAVPDSISVCDTMITIGGAQKNAVYAISGVCDLSRDANYQTVKHPQFNFFIQQDSIGPVAYRYDSHGTRMLVGGWTWEDWVLRSPIKTITTLPATARDRQAPLRIAVMIPGAPAGIKAGVYLISDKLHCRINCQGRCIRDMEK